MGKGRLEAFSDGVIAIIITIMVLELKTPEHPTLAALCERWPLAVSYVLSFFFVGVSQLSGHWWKSPAPGCGSADVLAATRRLSSAKRRHAVGPIPTA